MSASCKVCMMTFHSWDLSTKFWERFDKTISAKPTVNCIVFEDNLQALELANVPKMHPWAKHIGNKYHHFCDKVCDKTIPILAVATANQVADYLTQPLPRNSFQKHCKALQKWWHNVFKASSWRRECENRRFDHITFTYHAWTNYSSLPLESATWTKPGFAY